VLLVIDADTRAPRESFPVREYDVQRRLLDADVIDRNDVAAHWLASRVGRRFGTPAGLMVLASMRLRRYRAVYCDSEMYGIVLSLLVKLTPLRTAVFFLAHWPTRRTKAFVLCTLRAHRGTAGVFVHTSALVERLTATGVPRDKVHLLPIAVDTDFWSPQGARSSASDFVSSAGVELRDYATLATALRGLPEVRARVAASSPYSRHGNSIDGLELPSNFERVHCDTLGLRDEYESSLFVVVPVVESEIGAGLTTIAEAMSMGKAVITSRAEGQSDTLSDNRARLRSAVDRTTSGNVVRLSGLDVEDPDLAGPTGLYVTPGDPDELRAAVRYLVEHPSVAQDMGQRARRVAERVLAVERFGEATSEIILSTLGAKGAQTAPKPPARRRTWGWGRGREA